MEKNPVPFGVLNLFEPDWISLFDQHGIELDDTGGCVDQIEKLKGEDLILKVGLPPMCGGTMYIHQMNETLHDRVFLELSNLAYSSERRLSNGCRYFISREHSAKLLTYLIVKSL